MSRDFRTLTGCGVLYIATGQQYRQEAMRSARSVQAAMPGLPITVLSDAAIEGAGGVDVRQLTAPRFGFGDKVASMSSSPYEKTLFVDTDTHICGDLSEAFALLDDFDILLAHDAIRTNRSDPLQNRAVPEFNSGVIFFRKSPAALDCLAEWQRLYDLDCANHDGRQMPDQFTLRPAVQASRARLYVLLPEFHCMLWEASYLCDEVRLLHGRHELPMAAIAAQANALQGPRIFKAGLGASRVRYKTDILQWSAGLIWSQLSEMFTRR